MNLEPVRRALDALGARYALIGAHAMAARGYPRSTVDIDLLTSDTRVFDTATWGDLTRAGGQLDLRDAAALLALSDRSTIAREVDAHIGELGHEARDAWRELLAAADRSA